ncbi:MAG: cell division protein FtsZ [Thermoplasmata archaeon]|nr:cell division protein FtsZ [Thermoplasmata archaeon]
MKSFIEEALAKTGATATPDPRQFSDEVVDEELREMLEKMKINVKIVGVGGGGCNTVTRLSEEGIYGAESVAMNTDAQHLLITKSQRKILLGKRITKGLGAGALPEVGEEAARESEDELKKLFDGAHLVFITCGLGGGTGTGAIPMVSKIAKELGALVVAFVTLPFRGEGMVRMENAEAGLEKLKRSADAVVVIPNDKLLDVVPRLPLNTAFKVIDEILAHAIKGTTEMITKPGLVNLDYNDLKTVLKDSGLALMGMGESANVGDARALEAITKALHSPFLDVGIDGARGAMIHVEGGEDMTLAEAEKIAEEVQARASPTARIIWGARVNPEMEHVLRATVIATGVEEKKFREVVKGKKVAKAPPGIETVR